VVGGDGNPQPKFGRRRALPFPALGAEKIGHGIDAPGSLRKERALVELNAVVLHSVAEAGGRIVEHHTASEEFGRFGALEKAAGRAGSAEGDWMMPPLAGAATPVSHQTMSELQLRPESKRGRPEKQSPASVGWPGNGICVWRRRLGFIAQAGGERW
jgi:nitric oxide synthase oxygenase domain/subunit